MTAICRVDGCDGQPWRNRGTLCNPHRTRLAKYGTFDPLPTVTPTERFWARAAKDVATGCWNWTGATTDDGYGQSAWNRRSWLSHRLAYVLSGREIPAGYEVDHLCFNRACVNPDHLEAVTPAENQRRKAAHRTHCKNGHEYTIENTRYWNGGRICRACCKRIAAARYQRRKQLAESAA